MSKTTRCLIGWSILLFALGLTASVLYLMMLRGPALAQ